MWLVKIYLALPVCVSIKLKFRATAGSSFTGDIAIDDIRFQLNCCASSAITGIGIERSAMYIVWQPMRPVSRVGQLLRHMLMCWTKLNAGCV